MRQDQYEKLQTLEERLTDVFLTEADPDNWPGATTPFDQHDKAIRGDRYWMKRNAVATISLMQRISHLTHTIQQQSSAGAGAGAVTEAEDDLNKEIDAAEREAKKLMERMQGKGKDKFDKKVHGKPA